MFRKELLSALDDAIDTPEKKSLPHIKACLGLIEVINKSNTLGKAVDDAFSLKIQKRLASTVPPKPMIKIKFEDAIDHLTRFCQDFIDAQTIVGYTGTHNLRVSSSSLGHILQC